MKDKRSQQADQRRKLALQKKYESRITTARQGRDYFAQKDFVNATKKYQEYLGLLAELNEIDDIYRLSPTMFDHKKQVTEMLLISHVFWDMARINEMTPKLQDTFQKNLAQFVRFTANQPYQVLNAEMIRKYIKKNQKRSPQIPMLNQAYQEIFVQSKKCYIATMCLGTNHPYTETLREFKTVLLKFKLGQKFVELYYRFSSPYVEICSQNKTLKFLTNLLAKPLLSSFALTLKRSIFK
jgi:hypothetical protein